MQASFSELEYATKNKQTRRDRFLEEIEAITPWSALIATITPHYPVNDGRGRPTTPLKVMLRMYVAQQCFGLSDEGIEDALYDSQAIRRFVGINLGRQTAPDATTLLNFRHLLESHQLTASIFSAINAHLAERGLFMRTGTIVDATLIAAPSSTKNKDGKRDGEMQQTRKGKQWYFVRFAHSAVRNHRLCRCPASPSAPGGMKAHIGVDANSGLVHTVVGTAANVSDITQAQALLYGEETDVFGDAGYQGIEKREENLETPVNWHIAMRKAKRRALDRSPLGEMMEKLEQAKASIRAKVEHPFHVVKNLFRHRKTRYKGLAKDTAQLLTLFGFANLVLARRWLLTTDSQVAP